jgi:hypothetical protein
MRLGFCGQQLIKAVVMRIRNFGGMLKLFEMLCLPPIYILQSVTFEDIADTLNDMMHID